MHYHDRFIGGMPNQPTTGRSGWRRWTPAPTPGTAGSSPSWAAEGLEPWGGVRWVGLGGSPQPTYYVDVTGHFEPAVALLEAHQEYNGALSDDFLSRESSSG